MSLIKKWCSGIAIAGVLLLMASCGEGPTGTSGEAPEVGAVLAKGGQGGGGGPKEKFRDVDVHVPSAAENALIGDPESVSGLDYIGGFCGTRAKAASSFSFWPFYGGMNRKEMKDYENNPDCWVNGSLIRRWLRVDLASARVHKICRPGDSDFDPSLESCPNDNPSEHEGEMTLGEWAASSNPLDDPAGRDTVRVASVGIFDSETGFSRAGLRIDYCGAASHPLKFDASRFVGSNDVSLSRSGSSTHIATQTGPDDNVGLCGHYDATSGQSMVLLLHVDFEYDVKDKPSG
jgi:hypothetical protein